MVAYDAFISYSRALDKPIAAALQSVIQKLGKPWYRRRALRVFRDDTSLSASPHLWDSIEEALDQSRYLVLLASPQAAISPWVAKEIAWWLEHKGVETLLIGLTDGQLGWNEAARDFAWSASTPLPNILEGRFPADPRWVDLRPHRTHTSARERSFIEAGADFAATIHGRPKDDLLSQEVRQQRRALSLAWSAAASLLVLAALAFWQSQAAERARQAAVVAETAARQQTAIAEAQRTHAEEQTRLAQAERTEAQQQRITVLVQLSAAERLRGNLDRAVKLAVHAVRLTLALGERMPIGELASAQLAATISAADWRLVLTGREGPVGSASFGLGGQLIVVVSNDGTARIWDAVTGKVLIVLSGHGPIGSATFSPDGTRLATIAGAEDVSSDDKTEQKSARIWDMTTGREIVALRGHQDRIRSIAYSSNGRWIVTASDDQTIRIWDAITGQPERIIQGHKMPVLSARFSPDGKYIVSASEDQTVRIWDVSTGRNIKIIADTDFMQSAEFNPDGKSIVTVRHVSLPDGYRAVPANEDSAVRIISTNGAEIRVLRGHSADISTASFSPDGKQIVMASSDGTAEIWDATTGKRIAVLQGHERSISTAVFSPDGKQILTASEDGTARLWNARPGKEAMAFRGKGLDMGEGGGVTTFSRDGGRIMTKSDATTVAVLDASNAKQLLALQGHQTPVDHASFSPDERQILTVAGEAWLWDAPTGTKLAVLSGHTEAVETAQFNFDGTRIVTGSQDRTARLWDAKTGKPLLVLRGHEQTVRSARFSSDGARVVTASDDETARVWDAANGAELFRLVEKASTDIIAVDAYATFSSDNTRILTITGEIAQLWDAASRRRLEQLQGLPGDIRSATFSPDGSRIVTDAGYKIQVWDTVSGRETILLDGRAPSYSQDGRYIVTVIGPKLQLWNAIVGKPIALLDGGDGWIMSPAFSPDGKFIAAEFDTGSTKIWDVHFATMGREALLVEACTQRLRGLSALNRDEMRLIGEPDDKELIDVCAGLN